MRVKRLIDRSVVLASDLVASKDRKNSNNIIQELQSLLLEPRIFVDASAPADTIPDQPAQSYRDTYRRNRAQLNPLQQPGALLVERGEIAAWKRLKRQELQAQQADAIRAALNYYTSRLSFSASAYVLNAVPSRRSQMIRNDQLPDVKQVIQSDMGLRYLWRNQVLTAVADARAELQYQLGLELQQDSSGNNSNSNSENTIDATDLLELLLQAQQAMDGWLSLVEERDVQEAWEALLAQGEDEGVIQ